MKPPRPSATLILVRDAADAAGVEVLLVRRADRGDQNSNAWVFPGGLVDTSDRDLHAHFLDLDDAAASARLGLAQGGLDYWAAALRETLEEAGLLMAVDEDGVEVDPGEHRELLLEWRAAGRDRARDSSGAAFAALCETRGWRLLAQRLHPIAHWITPLGMPKRFDTRFLLGLAPPRQAVEVDGHEIVDHAWARLDTLLAGDEAERGEAFTGVRVRGPVRAIAADLARQGRSAADLLQWAAQLGPAAPIQPRLARDARDRVVPVHPTHPAFAEIGRIDPEGRGLASQVLRPGMPVALSDRLWRLTANNGSVMTGPGTNTYLLRASGGRAVLIDPGPDDEAHVRATLALLEARGLKLAVMLVTHTHIDHSPAWRALQDATGAPVHGRVADHPQWQDTSFVPDVALSGGERLDFGDGLVLEAIHTPGHASNHLCWLYEGERLLFTGDHVMQGSTVVINPPDGDMAAYLASLDALSRDRRFDTLAPGHGFLVEQPQALLQALIAHRRKREAKVAAALAALESGTLDQLVLRAYDDVPAERHGIAKRSLLAHLLHLGAQGAAVREDDGRWSAV